MCTVLEPTSIAAALSSTGGILGLALAGGLAVCAGIVRGALSGRSRLRSHVPGRRSWTRSHVAGRYGRLGGHVPERRRAVLRRRLAGRRRREGVRDRTAGRDVALLLLSHH